MFLIMLQSRVHQHQLEMIPNADATAQTRNTHHSHIRRWIVFDGDMFRSWTTTLDSALTMATDAVLCLPNSERIRMPRNGICDRLFMSVLSYLIVRFLFEVDDLKHASPSSINRCGFVYMQQPVSWNILLSVCYTDIVTTN